MQEITFNAAIILSERYTTDWLMAFISAKKENRQNGPNGS